MSALVGLTAVVAGVWYLVATGDVRGLYFAIAAYVSTGVLLQRNEGRISAGRGYFHGYGDSSGSPRSRMPDPAVRWHWRLRVAAFWLPWLSFLRSSDVASFLLAGARYVWQFAVFGSGTPPVWNSRRRIFRKSTRTADRRSGRSVGDRPAFSAGGLELRLTDAIHGDEREANGKVPVGVR